MPAAVKASRELGGGVLLNRSERQNAYTVGIQQGLGAKVRLDVDFWWRRATYPGDQDQFKNTGIVLPVTFSSGRHHGWDARIDLAETHGLRGFLPLGHTRALYVPPPVGGLFLDVEAIDAITGGPFLIDHDQKLQAQADLLNAFDTEGVYNIESVFGGTHVIPPRTLSVRLRYSVGRHGRS